MPYTLNTSLSSVATSGTVTRDAGGRVYINDTITLNTGAVVDVDLTCVGFVLPTGQTVTFGRTAPDGTDVPISVVMTAINNAFNTSPFRIQGNPTLNVRNTTFHMLNGANMWGSWPEEINTTGSTLNATNMRIVSYSSLTTRAIDTNSGVHVWIPGNGVIDGLEVSGIGGLFFNASPLSTKNIQQRVTTAQGISVASSGETPVDLVGVVAQRVNVQQAPCHLRITNLRLLSNYVRNAATGGLSKFSIRKSIGGTLVGASANTVVSVWNTTTQALVYTRNVGTSAFNPLVDCWLVYQNNVAGATAAQIEAGFAAEPGSYVPNVRIAVLEYGRALAIKDYTMSIRQSMDDQPIDLSQILANSDIAETNSNVVSAWTEINTGSRFRDRAHLFLRQNWSGQNSELVSLDGNLINAGSLNVTIDATAASVFSLVGNTLTIKASTYTGDMTTTGVITLANGATFVGTRTDASGTIAPPKTVSITGITAGSRLRVYNNTTASEVVNQIVAGTSYSATYNEGTGYTTGNTLTITTTWQSGTSAKLPFSTQVVVGSTGWSALVNQQNDTVYNGIGVDGSTITEFTPDYPNVQVDISDPNGQTSIDRLYSWFVSVTTSADGIRNWFGGIVAEDAANFRVVTSILNLKLDNLSANGVEFTGGQRLYRDDNASPLVASTTGGGSISLYAGKVYTSVVSTSSPVITGDISQVPAAVQSGMTAQGYTIARAGNMDRLDANISTRLAAASYTAPPSAANNANAVRTELTTELTRIDVAVSTRTQSGSTVNANVTQVNGIVIDGVGTEANPWGPVE